jgi:outer membrane protein assembly factor BamB
MVVKPRVLLVLVLALAALATACSGGGGSNSILPRSPASPGEGEGLFTIHIPAKTNSSIAKRPAYVSPSTQSVSFQVAPNPAQVVPLVLGSSSCPLASGYYSCTANFDAPIGSETMVIETFASTNGTGPVLSMNSIPITITAGTVNQVNVVLNGVVSTMTLALSPTFVTLGTPSDVTAAWEGLDASGNTIIGPGSLVNGNGVPVTPSLSSSSLNFKLTVQPTASPGAWTVAYDGAAASPPTFTLSATGYSSVTAQLSISSTSDWDSYGYDLERTGYNPNETTVGASNVANLEKIWTFSVGSGMVREPVLASGVNINGTATNVLYAGSNLGATMYAINAETGAEIWAFGPVPTASFTCNGNTSQFSISQAPAIDRVNNRIYFADGYNQLHAVDLSKGTEDAGWPITIADYTPDHNFMHGGLTYNPANGMLYAVTGSTCDISPWYGRIVAINTNTAQIVGTFFGAAQQGSSGVQYGSGGGIWGFGGASIDPATNDVYIGTGNADVSDSKNGNSQSAGYSEEVVELSPNVTSILANNYPANIPSITGDYDFDFGATPLLFQPPNCPPLLAAMNKSGMFELYDRSSIASGPVQYIQMSISSDSGYFIGSPAYDPITNYVYVELPTTEGIYEPGLGAFSIASNCTLNPTPIWSAAFGPSDASRSPLTIANGVIYVANGSGDTEYAFNAATGDGPLWSVGLSTSSGVIGTLVANGIVYVNSSGGTITAWALPTETAAHRRRATP